MNLQQNINPRLLFFWVFFNPSQQINTIHLLTHSPLVEWGENQKDKKVNKLLGGDKNSLIVVHLPSGKVWETAKSLTWGQHCSATAKHQCGIK